MFGFVLTLAKELSCWGHS